MEAVVVVVAEVVEAVSCMVRASPAARGEVAVQDEVMYCQKVSLAHSR